MTNNSSKPRSKRNLLVSSEKSPPPRPPRSSTSNSKSPSTRNLTSRKIVDRAMGIIGECEVNNGRDDDNKPRSGRKSHSTHSTTPSTHSDSGHQSLIDSGSNMEGTVSPTDVKMVNRDGRHHQQPQEHHAQPHYASVQERLNESVSLRLRHVFPGQLNASSSMMINGNGCTLDDIIMNDVQDERPIVDDDDYISLASTLATESICPLDAYETNEIRRLRREGRNGEKAVQQQDRRMHMVRQKLQQQDSEQRWMNSSSRELRHNSSSGGGNGGSGTGTGLFDGPSPPSRRESMSVVVSTTSSCGSSKVSKKDRDKHSKNQPGKNLAGERHHQPVETTSPSDSGIEVNEAIQVGFAVLRALKASGGDGQDSEMVRNMKKEEIMKHLHNMISDTGSSNNKDQMMPSSKHDEKVQALDAIEGYLDMHQSNSNSHSNSSRSKFVDDAPSKPCRTRSNDDLELSMNLDKNSTRAGGQEDSADIKSKKKTSKFIPASFGSKGLSSDTAHTSGTVSISMPSLVDFESLVSPMSQHSSSVTQSTSTRGKGMSHATILAISALDETLENHADTESPKISHAKTMSSTMSSSEQRTPRRKGGVSNVTTRRPRSCQNLMESDHETTSSYTASKCSVKTDRQEKPSREFRRSLSERHIADDSVGASPCKPRSQSKLLDVSRSSMSKAQPKKQKSLSNLNDYYVDDEAHVVRRGRKPSKSKSTLDKHISASASPRKGRRPTRSDRSVKSTATKDLNAEKPDSRRSLKDNKRRSSDASVSAATRTRSRSRASGRSKTPTGNRSRSKDPAPSSRRQGQMSPTKRPSKSKSSRTLGDIDSSVSRSSVSPLKRSMSIAVEHVSAKSTGSVPTRHSSISGPSTGSSEQLGTDSYHAWQNSITGIPPAPYLDTSPPKLISNPKDTKSYYQHAPMSASSAATRKSLSSYKPKSLRSIGSTAFPSLDSCTSPRPSLAGGEAAIARMDWQKSHQKEATMPSSSNDSVLLSPSLKKATFTSSLSEKPQKEADLSGFLKRNKRRSSNTNQTAASSSSSLYTDTEEKSMAKSTTKSLRGI